MMSLPTSIFIKAFFKLLFLEKNKREEIFIATNRVYTTGYTGASLYRLLYKMLLLYKNKELCHLYI
jgi:hypothetical protein